MKIKNLKNSLVTLVAGAMCLFGSSCSSINQDSLRTGFDYAKKPIQNHLAVGARYGQFSLDKTHRDEGFVGSITDLEEEQSSTPQWFIDYNIIPYLGVELTQSKIRANAWTSSKEGPGPSDGFYELGGNELSVFARWPNFTGVTPYVGAGMINYEGNFDAAPWWAKGYNNPEIYEELGPEPRKNKTRKMILEDTTGTTIYGGLTIKLFKGLEADLRFEKVSAETEISFESLIKNRAVSHRGPYSVPFDHTRAAIGLKYNF
ncbi:MAG: hypothetical protein Q8L27_03070 [archaeon]|nr:hypothetical protein [archaeon]